MSQILSTEKAKKLSIELREPGPVLLNNNERIRAKKALYTVHAFHDLVTLVQNYILDQTENPIERHAKDSTFITFVEEFSDFSGTDENS